MVLTLLRPNKKRLQQKLPGGSNVNINTKKKSKTTKSTKLILPAAAPSPTSSNNNTKRSSSKCNIKWNIFPSYYWTTMVTIIVTFCVIFQLHANTPRRIYDTFGSDAAHRSTTTITRTTEVGKHNESYPLGDYLNDSNNKSQNETEEEKYVRNTKKQKKKSSSSMFCDDCIVKTGPNKAFRCYDRARHLAGKYYDGKLNTAKKSLLDKGECIILDEEESESNDEADDDDHNEQQQQQQQQLVMKEGFCNHCNIDIGFNNYRCDERAEYLSTKYYNGNLMIAQKSLMDDGECGGEATTNFTMIPRHQLCFVTSNFADTLEMADKPPKLSKDMLTKPKRHFLFTNLRSLDDVEDYDGWDIILMNDTELPYKRRITQSRWPKFMGWKHPRIQKQKCRVIFYGDTYIMNPVDEPTWQRMANAILSSEVGFMQGKQIGTFTKGPESELWVTTNTGKSTRDLTIKTIDWLRNQSNYNPRSNVYKNAIFGYDPTNVKWQNVTEDFWLTYSREELTWRDQPLWSYFLSKHGLTPLPMVSSPPKEGVGMKGFNNHKYNTTTNQ